MELKVGHGDKAYELYKKLVPCRRDIDPSDGKKAEPWAFPNCYGPADMMHRAIEMAAELGIGSKVLFTVFLRGDDVQKIYGSIRQSPAGLVRFVKRHVCKDAEIEGE